MNAAELGISLVKVVAVGLLLGAGLPAIFAIGIRATAAVETGPDGVERMTTSGRVRAVVCFGVVLAAVVAGIVWIVSGGH
ncbi:hypothetical protein ATL41_0210 [Flavimobilis soli]|uniref:Uncharacterized protein n=1 Tax=Flavimobilis soli TaxID=442709 RepID=A0A2A9EA37_9MICO|nr:hypothetical protein [Flavimobilis soli]PFG35526.1 hypothetical protein ATL41_0210 [Flavimobilis soli]